MSQRQRSMQLLVKQCQDFSTAGRLRSKTSAIREFVTGRDMLVILEKQTSAIKAFVTGRDALVVFPTGGGKTTARCPWDIRVECRYKATSTTTSIQHVEHVHKQCLTACTVHTYLWLHRNFDEHETAKVAAKTNGH